MILEPSVRKVATALYEHLNTPRSLTAAMLIKAGEWDQLVDLRVDPRNYLEGSVGAERFRKDAQATDFLRKYPGVPLKRDLTGAAEETFLICEYRCRLTNAFLDLLRYPLASDPEIFGRMRSISSRARKIAKRILGPVPSFLDGAFGPGTSYELKGSTFTTVADKLWITPTTTEECAPVFEHMFWPTHWGRTRLREGLPLPELIPGNRFSTVPKDSTKRRGICIEPLGNLYCQLGIGRYLKRRLKGVGLDVDRSYVYDCPIQRSLSRPSFDGQSKHRLLALLGSTGGGWATLDLSNASDTVALELVRDVLPPDWFDLLYACRSPHTRFRDEWVKLEKFSSMGNGFTFELETLLFACLISAATGLEIGSDLYVYGDDILLPEKWSREAQAVLEAFGFEVNRQKSFDAGPFRESCGGDFFSGYNVRSVFLTKNVDSPIKWVALHNELARRWGFNLSTRRCVDAIPLNFRVGVPRKLGHLGLWGFPEKRRIKDQITWVRTLVDNPDPLPLDRWGRTFTYTLALLGVPSVGLVPRGTVTPALGWYSIS